MKKLFYLLLLFTSAFFAQVPPDATQLENIQITNNVQDNTATKVTVQTNAGVQNWLPMANLPISTATQTALNLKVSTVTGSGFLVSSGGINPNLTITTATTSTGGALTSTDWNTFNNKAPATGGAGYIQNQNASAQSANMWISGTGTFQRSNAVALESNILGSFGQTLKMSRIGTGVSVGLGIVSSGELGFYSNNSLVGSIKNSGEATFLSTVTASNGTLIGGTLTSGYIPKATGTNSLGNSTLQSTSNGFFSDDGVNGRLTFENLSGQNDILSTTTAFGACKDLRYTANNHIFRTGSTEILRTSGSNVLINTTTDDGVNKLQVNGSVSFTKDGRQATFTGSDQGAIDIRRSTVQGFRIFVDTNNFGVYDLTNNTTRLEISNTTGVVKVSNLSGTGTRIVTADASGNLSTSSGYATLASPSLTGTPTAPEATLPNQVVVKSQLDLKQNILTNSLTGDGSQTDPTTYALQDGTTLYHSVKWFVPTGTVSTSGTTVTSVGTQFTAAMVGAKLTINGEWRIITAVTNTTTVTVASAYSQNYSGVVAGNWGVYSKSISFTAADNPNLSGGFVIYNNQKSLLLTANYDRIQTGLRLADSGNNVAFNTTGVADSFQMAADKNLVWYNGLSSGYNALNTTKDLGLRRNAAGILEIYDGITATGLAANRRDLLVRNVYSEPATLSNQVVTKAQLDLKADLSSPSFTGTPTAPTATAGTNTTQVATTAFVQSVARPYKVYTALLTQTGTNAPVATVLENTLGGTVVWSYIAPGWYSATLTGAFTASKTVAFINGYIGNDDTYGIKRADTNEVFVISRRGGIVSNEVLQEATVEIRVYPLESGLGL